MKQNTYFNQLSTVVQYITPQTSAAHSLGLRTTGQWNSFAVAVTGDSSWHVHEPMTQ